MNLFILPLRLLRIAWVLARWDALAVVESLGLFPRLVAFLRLVMPRRPGRPGQKLARALVALGPSFVKLGQFLATRSDVVGEALAADLAELQDRLPPFPFETARAEVEAELGMPLEAAFASFEPRPVSAASIAQVHFATALDPLDPEAPPRPVAVKVLRPGIERAFEHDLHLFFWLAPIAERTQPRLRRLKPVAVLETFAATVRFEMDLRLEAAACSELAENFHDDETYHVPEVDWHRSGQRVLTQSRLSGIRLDDRERLLAAGHDLEEVLRIAATIFFNQVFRDGFFHGDQHPGNMFVTADGSIGAVDFGIMGRLDHPTRKFLADMLLATLSRDYKRLAEVHREAGWLPPDQSLELFAQALRAVCEPIFGQPLARVSFARLLGQLFSLTETFDLQVQPALVLLQKNMLMAEGVSRRLDPTLNIWLLAEPLIAQWMRENRGVEARIRDGVADAASILQQLPGALANLEKTLAQASGPGVRVDGGSIGTLQVKRKGGWQLPFLLGLLLGAIAVLILGGG